MGRKYTVQDTTKTAGIAQGLIIAEDFLDGSNVCLF